MQTSDRPPTRTSISATVQVKPFGPHHCSTYSGSVHDFQASSSGAGMSRVPTTSKVSVMAAEYGGDALPSHRDGGSAAGAPAWI